jgi:hypothetical protein
MVLHKLSGWARYCAVHREQLSTLVVGWTVNMLMVYGFDYVLYSYVLYTCGTIHGWIIMVFASLLVCLLTLKFYDWSKKDWIGIEAVKGLRENDANHKLGRMLSWALRKSDWVILVVLSIKFDPLITALYLRHGANQFNGFANRDWRNFFLSLIISNLYWGMIILAGINVFQFVWVLIKGYFA